MRPKSTRHSLMTTTEARGWSRTQVAWALYECARNPFYVLVNIYVYSAYFTNTVLANSVRGQTLWGYSLAIAAVLIAVLAPFLGALADAGGQRKPWLLACICLAVPAIALLAFATPGMSSGIAWIVVALIAANVGYELSSIFFNALLPQVATPKQFGSVSGLAYMLANVAGILLFAAYLIFSYWISSSQGVNPSSHVAERMVGPIVALWFVVFAIPILKTVPDAPGTGLTVRDVWRRGVAVVPSAVASLRSHPRLLAFLIARMIFNEGFIILMLFMGVFSAGVLNWTAAQLSAMGLVLSMVAAVGASVAGRADDKYGSRRTLSACIIGAAVANILLVTITPATILFFSVDPSGAAGGYFPRASDKAFFLAMSIAAFFVTGGLVSSRAMLARLAPPEAMNEMFSLYALSGTATSFLGPLTIAILTQLFGNQRVGLTAGLAFFLVGFLLLNRSVKSPLQPEKEGRCTAI